MRRGELHVFMTRRDEDYFIDSFSVGGVALVNCWHDKKRRLAPLSSSPPRPEEQKRNRNPWDRPMSLNLVVLSKHPKIAYCFTTKRKMYQIDWQSSDVIEYFRGAINRDCVGLGHFVMGTYEASQQKPRYLVELWDELKRWLKQKFFALPKAGGYLGPDALQLALRKGKVASTELFSIRRGSNGKVVVNVISDENVLPRQPKVQSFYELFPDKVSNSKMHASIVEEIDRRVEAAKRRRK